jgi:hypothetical protein
MHSKAQQSTLRMHVEEGTILFSGPIHVSYRSTINIAAATAAAITATSGTKTNIMEVI